MNDAPSDVEMLVAVAPAELFHLVRQTLVKAHALTMTRQEPHLLLQDNPIDIDGSGRC